MSEQHDKQFHPSTWPIRTEAERESLRDDVLTYLEQLGSYRPTGHNYTVFAMCNGFLTPASPEQIAWLNEKKRAFIIFQSDNGSELWLMCDQSAFEGYEGRRPYFSVSWKMPNPEVSYTNEGVRDE